jgi:hypothetical protein
MDERVAFFDAEYPIPGGWDWLTESNAEFWDELASQAGERLIWLAPTSSSELAGYLAYLDRFADVPAEVVRPNDYLQPHPRYGPHLGLGSMNAEELADAFANAPRYSIEADRQLAGRWSELMEENAMLRIVEDGALISAPIDHYDHFILGATPPKWTRAVRVVGDAIGATFDEQVRVNSDMLFSRLAALVRSGAIEAQGDVLGWTEEKRREPALVRRAA